MIGDDLDAPHMARAREAILARGGARRPMSSRASCSRSMARLRWRSVPTMPVEMMLLPRWFPVPSRQDVLLGAHGDGAAAGAAGAEAASRAIRAASRIPELFVAPPSTVAPAKARRIRALGWSAFFGGIDWLLKRVEPFWPKGLRQRAIDACRGFRRPSG